MLAGIGDVAATSSSEDRNPGPVRPRIAIPAIRDPEFRAILPHFHAQSSGSRCFTLIYGNRGDFL
jgi:hypothetical protein